MPNRDAVLFKRAKGILREHHGNFAELSARVKQMLAEDLGLDADFDVNEDLVSWVAYIIRAEDWKSLSTQRINDFLHGDGSDFIEWMSITLTRDYPDDGWFKPYVEKEELTEAHTLAERLTIGMRTSYWLGDADNAASHLKAALKELAQARLEPAQGFAFADYFIEMMGRERYGECCDLLMLLPNIALDNLSKERVLAQAIAAAMRCGRYDAAQAAVDMAADLPHFERDVLPFNLACYFATVGGDVQRMYDYIEIAVQNGKAYYDFNDSDFDSHRGDPMFNALIHGKSRAEAEAMAQVIGSLEVPATPQAAAELIAKLRAVADGAGAGDSGTENVISEYFGVKCESFGFPAQVPTLDDILRNFGHLLPGKTLVDLFVIAFNSMEANYQVALDAVGRLADSQSQMQIADAFMRAGKYYDAGHRADDDTVHDQLIDDVFPNFNDDALIYLLEICDTQYLAADGMMWLFKALLERDPAQEIKQRAYSRLVAMYAQEGDSDYYFYQFKGLFEELLPLLPEGVQEQLADINPEMWEDFSPRQQGATEEDEHNVAPDRGTPDTETGHTGTLIPPGCDYSVFAYFYESGYCYYCLSFYSDGSSYTLNIDSLKYPHRFEPKAWFKLVNMTKGMECEYTLTLGGEPADGTQGDALTMKIWGVKYTGGFNVHGDIVLTTVVDRKPVEIVYKYLGYVKGGRFITA